MRLFLGNLPFNASEDELREHFKACGFDVLSIAIIKDRITTKSRGFGFVEVDDSDALRVLTEMNEQLFQGRRLHIEQAKEDTFRRKFRRELER